MKQPIRWIGVLTAVWMMSAGAQEFTDTAVPKTQVAAVVDDIAKWHDRQNPGCRFSKAVGSHILNKTSDYTEERWTIKGCSDKSFSYRVTVMTTDGGGISDMVSNLE